MWRCITGITVNNFASGIGDISYKIPMSSASARNLCSKTYYQNICNTLDFDYIDLIAI